MISLTVSPSPLHSFSQVDSDVKIKCFQAGEVNVTLDEKAVAALKDSSQDRYPSAHLVANIRSSDDFMALMLTVSAIRAVEPRTKITAMIPYFPYARQDRICNPGEALSVAVAASLINSLNLEQVTIVDPHSSVTPSLVNNVEVRSQEYYLSKMLSNQIKCHQNLHVMAPDQGAYKKVFDIAAKHDFAGFLYAIKDRDPKTMAIKNVAIQGDVVGKHILVLDDICDGGRTFLELGKQLREAGAASIQLFVTHGIFSYGIASLCELYDRIYTTDSFHPCIGGQQPKVELVHDKLAWISL